MSYQGIGDSVTRSANDAGLGLPLRELLEHRKTSTVGILELLESASIIRPGVHSARGTARDTTASK